MKKHERQVASSMLKVFLGVIGAIQLSVTAAYGGWTQTAAGTYNYLDTGNWADGSIDNVFPSSTTLLAAQTATFNTNHTLASALDFSYGGNFALTVRADGTGARTLTLGGDVNLNTAGGTTANVTFGNQSTANQFLHVDLGGTNRTFTVATGRRLWFWNNLVGNGELIKNGAGELVLRAQTSTFMGNIVVNGGTLTIGEQGAIADACLGNIQNDVSLLNGASLKFGSSNDKAHVLLSPLRDFTLSGGASFSAPYGSARVNIGGDIQGTGGLQCGPHVVLLSGNNTFSGGINSSGGGVMVSSDRNLGAGSLTIPGVGVTFSVFGTEYTNFGSRTVTFTSGNNGGVSLNIRDPANTFTIDQTMAIGNLNASSITALTKTGAGELLIVAPQTYNNATPPSTGLSGGTFTVDYAAGGSLYGTNHKLGFGGGVLQLLGKGAALSVTQDFSHVRFNAGGGSLLVNNRSGSGNTVARLGDFTTMTHDVGGSLRIRTLNPGTGAATVTSTQANDASGIIGAGRVIYGDSDWASIVGGTTVGGYTGYTVGLPSSGASSSVNYIHTGNGTVTASETANTLKLSTTQGGESLAISADQNLSLKTGGLLFVGANDYTVSGGTLTASTNRMSTTSGQDLVIQHYGAGTLTLGSVITNAAGPVARIGTTTSTTKIVTGLSSTADLYAGMAVKVDGGASTSIASVNSASQITLNANSGITGTPLLMFTSVNALTIAGTGTVKLTSANTYSGQTFVNGATLEISNNNQLNNGANTQLNLAAGKLKATETITTARPVMLNGGGATFDVADGKTLTLSGSVFGGNLVLENSDSGSGVLELKGDNSQRDNALLGDVIIKAGVLKLSHNNAFHLQGFNTVQFGTATTQKLQINGARTITVAGLTSGSSTAVIENGATGAAQFNVYNGADNTFSGVMQDGAAGTLAFAKGGCGTLTLPGTQTYTGATTVQGGVLAVNGSLAAASAVTVQKGALGGTGTVNGTVTVKNGGAIAPGSGGVGTLNTGALTLEAGAALNVEVGSSGADLIAVTGNLTLGGVVNVMGLDGFDAGHYTIMTYTGTLAGVEPEVGTTPDPDLNYTVRASDGVVTLLVGAPASVIVIR